MVEFQPALGKLRSKQHATLRLPAPTLQGEYMQSPYDGEQRPVSRAPSLGERLTRAALVPLWEASGWFIARSYAQLLDKYGDSAQALAERADEKSTRFYQELLRNVDFSGSLAVLDTGSGRGDMIKVLANHNAVVSRYLGIDLVRPFVEWSREHYPAHYQFEQANMISPRFHPDERFDLVVAMGMLVSRVWQYERYVASVIDKLLQFSRRYVVFNVITEADTSLGNYTNMMKVGEVTVLPREQLVAILEAASQKYGATYTINEMRIYPDSTDAFVCLTLHS